MVTKKAVGNTSWTCNLANDACCRVSAHLPPVFLLVALSFLCGKLVPTSAGPVDGPRFVSSDSRPGGGAALPDQRLPPGGKGALFGGLK